MLRINKYIKNPFLIFLSLASKGFFDFMNDKLYLKLMYRANTGKKLNLKNPKTFNEKLQWLKLYDRKPKYTTMVDKYEVKNYVAEKIGKEYIIPTLGVWDSFDEIDFDVLPNQFVLKCTNDSGGLYICRDKSKFDYEIARKKIERSLKRNYFLHGREWPYKNVKPRIIAEKYMSNGNENVGLTDYKFYCFNGIPKYLYVSMGLENHATARISFLDMDWSFADFGRTDYRPLENLPHKPKNFDKMVEIAKKLSSDNAFLRVDLYEINDKIYFSELTFTPCSGMMPFKPQQADLELGELLDISKIRKV